MLFNHNIKHNLNMSPMSKSIWMLTILLLTMKFVAAEEEDDENIITDLMIGVGIAICEEFVMCKLFMVIMGFVGTLIVLIGLCSGEITCEDICNRRNARRGFTSGVGYGVTRSIRG